MHLQIRSSHVSISNIFPNFPFLPKLFPASFNYLVCFRIQRLFLQSFSTMNNKTLLLFMLSKYSFNINYLPLCNKTNSLTAQGHYSSSKRSRIFRIYSALNELAFYNIGNETVCGTEMREMHIRIVFR